MNRRVVDVVVPAFNAERTLSETLASVVGEPGVARILVIDDGSEDETLSIAQSFGSPVEVLTGSNRGVSAARNRGIAETSAEWLLFLDSDDLLLPGSVLQRLITAEISGADVVVCDWEDFIDEGAGGRRRGNRRSLDWTAINSNAEVATATSAWATTAAILYRRALVARIGGFHNDLPVIQDARFLFDAAYQGARFAHSEHVGARYRQSVGSLSRRDPARFWRDVLLNGHQIEILWRERGALSPVQIAAVAGNYDMAARGLFAAADQAFFDAVTLRRCLDVPPNRFSRVAVPFARLVGLRQASKLLRLVRP